MRVLITGISGFVGKYLAPYLLSKGHEVVGIDRHGSAIEGCEVIPCDLLDREKLNKVIADNRPDYVYHLGGISSVSYSIANPEIVNQVNVNGTQNLFDAVTAAKISPKILVVSSAQVYGTPDKLPITESEPLKPKTPYAHSKIKQEKLCLEYKNLKTIIIRSFNHTGPGQQEEFVCSSFARQVAQIEAGKRAQIKVGNLEISRDFTDVRDVVRAYALAIEKCKTGQVYNMCSGRAYLLSDILNILKSISAAKINIAVEKKLVRPTDAASIYGSNEKLKNATGWQPQIPIEQTLKEMLEYWREEVAKR